MIPQLVVREFRPEDARDLWQLFFDTIHIVNIRDYSQEQVDAWAPREYDPANWQNRFEGKIIYVAESDGTLLGFGELEARGHIDRFYCHADYLGQGIGSAILNRIENKAAELGLSELDLEASITSFQFFERRGFRLIREQQVTRHQVVFKNFVMTKKIQVEVGSR